MKKAKKPEHDKKEVEKHATVTQLYIIELLEAIAEKLGITLEEPE